MAASSTVVIKVRYGDMLRRFNDQIVDGKLMLNMDGLRKKINSLFNFSPETELTLTYIDEDNDVVALVDDDDLYDVVKQGLNPWRITVKLNGEKSGSRYDDSSASSTPMRSPRVKQSLPNLNAGISEILGKVPEPLRDTLVKLSDDLASKASSSAPGISELADVISKVSLSFLGNPLESQSGSKSDVPEVNPHPTKTRNSERSEECGSEANMKSNEVVGKSATVQGPKAPSFDFNAVAAALDKQDENVPNLAPETHELGIFSHAIRRKEKFSKKNGPSVKNLPSVVDKILTGKGASHISRTNIGTNSGIGTSYPTTADIMLGKTRSSGKLPTSIWAPPQGDCPFSGTALSDMPALLPPIGPFPFRGNVSQNDGSGNVFHRGVRCDGCGIHPIVGPRFKSKVKMDYDLCHVCFEEIGNSNDYLRMDRPAALPPVCLKGLHDVGRARYQTIPHVFRGPKSKLSAVKLDSRFIQDVNVFDGTVMAPSLPFTKIWKMRNNGTLMWPPKTQLVWIGGDKLSNALSVELQIPSAGLLVDQELDVAVDFISPELPGRYISYWRMASPSGQKFGQRVWVLIQVDASIKDTPREAVRNLNLNLPPISSNLTGPEIINVDPEPIVEDNHAVANNQKKPLESGKPDTDQELKFPINDSLLVGNGASTSVPSSSVASSSVSYPIIDLSDVPPPLPPTTLGPIAPPLPPPPVILGPITPSPPQPYVSPAILGPIAPPPPPHPASFGQSGAELPGKDQVEEKLLKELEEMGFRQVDLNKEVLRMNEYDLEQAVDDLCGVAEWDPILEELQEMGFNDMETNKMLLKKNNGSIKRVVMDLIAGEKF